MDYGKLRLVPEKWKETLYRAFSDKYCQKIAKKKKKNLKIGCNIKINFQAAQRIKLYFQCSCNEWSSLLKHFSQAMNQTKPFNGFSSVMILELLCCVFSLF